MSISIGYIAQHPTRCIKLASSRPILLLSKIWNGLSWGMLHDEREEANPFVCLSLSIRVPLLLCVLCCPLSPNARFCEKRRVSRGVRSPEGLLEYEGVGCIGYLRYFLVYKSCWKFYLLYVKSGSLDVLRRGEGKSCSITTLVGLQ